MIMTTAAQIATVGSRRTSVERSVHKALGEARLAQPEWEAKSVRTRLDVVRRFRRIVASRAESLAGSIQMPRRERVIDTLTAEVLPVLDACRFLERRAGRLLRSVRHGWRGRPLWLMGVSHEVRREPLGVMLVIGPGNYPLFLTAVQSLQALVAGNAVLLKPSPEGVACSNLVRDWLIEAGLPEHLLQVLDASPDAAQSAIEAGVNKVVLTGSVATGRKVLHQLAEEVVPAVMELSGCDAMFVRADADLDLVTRALRFGMTLNRSATCIAPRRVFVHQSLAAELESRLRAALGDLVGGGVEPRVQELLRSCVAEAVEEGAKLVVGHPGDGRGSCIVVGDVRPEMRLVNEDVFAPVLSLLPVPDDESALRMSRACPYALGASIFTADGEAGQRMASRVNAGSVVVNDLIVPTADPRLPFEGRGLSGFGPTRGAEGLLAMTQTKVISQRRRGGHVHFSELDDGYVSVISALIRALHGGGVVSRLAAVIRGMVQGWRVRKQTDRQGDQR